MENKWGHRTCCPVPSCAADFCAEGSVLVRWRGNRVGAGLRILMVLIFLWYTVPSRCDECSAVCGAPHNASVWAARLFLQRGLPHLLYIHGTRRVNLRRYSYCWTASDELERNDKYSFQCTAFCVQMSLLSSFSSLNGLFVHLRNGGPSVRSCIRRTRERRVMRVAVARNATTDTHEMDRASFRLEPPVLRICYTPTQVSTLLRRGAIFATLWQHIRMPISRDSC